jgi:hypothetical protein
MAAMDFSGLQGELRPDPAVSSSGLWCVDEAASPDPAGTYAIVIGASAYPHFDGGSSPAQNTYSFGQLYSSAYSAFQYFQWLTTSFRITGSPVRKVWLLLSPTADEARLIDNCDYAPATFQSCAASIRSWFKALSALRGDTAARSRSLFFFSGHGVEINNDKQVLLPADYLSTDPPMLTDAISTYNLYLGSGQLEVPIQCILADACRSDAEDLRQQREFDGAKILLEPFGGTKRRSAPIVYATSNGNSTYQSRVPTDLSFFTKGLLAGLYLRDLAPVPPLKPDQAADGRWVIKLPPLCEFLNASMNHSLELAGFVPDDPISIGGTQKAKPIVVSEVGGPGGVPTGTGNVKGGPGSGGPSAGIVSQGPVGKVIGKPTRGKEERFRSLQSVSGANEFGHEYVTSFFALAELSEFDGIAWSELPHRLLDHVTLVEGDGSDYRRVSFKPPDERKWYWLRCENDALEAGFLFPPTDREATDARPVEFAIESIAAPDWLDVRAVLAPQNKGNVARANDLWRSYIDLAGPDPYEQLFSAVRVRPGDVESAVSILYDKWESPLAATIGSMILLRGGTDEQGWRWQENLAERVAYSSDASIFVLQRMIQNDAFDLEVAQRCLASIKRLGLPFTAEAFGYIANLAPILEQQMPDALDSDTIERFNDFSAYTRPGSLFLSVAVSAKSAVKGRLRDRLLGSTAVA